MTANLPPLPPLPHDAEADFEPTGPNIIDVLADEHHQIRELSAQLADDTADITPERRKELSTVVTAMVSRHLSAEEQYLYPAVRDLFDDGDKLTTQELTLDNSMLKALSKLEKASPHDEGFSNLAVTVDDHVRQHSHNAAQEIHPRLRELATDEDLTRLGNRIEIAAEAAPTRPYPNSPSTPPWNKVVDPMLGTADKVRDALQGRTTYPDDIK